MVPQPVYVSDGSRPGTYQPYLRIMVVTISTPAIRRLSHLPKILVLLAALMVSPANWSFGQSETITFDEAVRIALDKNIELKKAENQVTLQESNVQAEKGDFLPNLNLSSRPSRSWGLTFDQTSGRLVSESSDFFSVGANSSVNLFNGFSDVASLSSAKHTLEADQYSLERARQTVFFDVVNRYLTLIVDMEQVEIRQEDLEAQRQQLARIEEFTNLGARPISDLYAQQATVANSELLLLDAERAQQLSEVRLIQVLELDPFKSYSFVAPDAEEISLDVDTYDLESLLTGAVERRLDLKAREYDLMSQDENIRVAKAARLPSLNLSGSAGTSYSSLRQELIRDIEGNIVGSEKIPFSDQFSDNRSGSVSLSLSVPVFNRFSVRNNVQRAQIQRENQALDLANLQQTISLEVRQAYLDYLSAAKRLDVTDKQLISAKQAEEVERERYNVGASTLVELQQARASFVDAASTRAQAIYQFVFQSKLIDYYVGIVDPNQPLFSN